MYIYFIRQMLKHGGEPEQADKFVATMRQNFLHTSEVDSKRLYSVFRTYLCVQRTVYVPSTNYQVKNFTVSSGHFWCAMYVCTISTTRKGELSGFSGDFCTCDVHTNRALLTIVRLAQACPNNFS